MLPVLFVVFLAVLIQSIRNSSVGALGGVVYLLTPQWEYLIKVCESCSDSLLVDGGVISTLPLPAGEDLVRGGKSSIFLVIFDARRPDYAGQLQQIP